MANFSSWPTYWTTRFPLSVLTLPAGVLTPITGSPFTANNAPFRVAIDPSGKFLDVTNNVGGNISVFTINSSTNSSNGLLSPIAGSPFGTLTQPKDLLIVKIP